MQKVAAQRRGSRLPVSITWVTATTQLLRVLQRDASKDSMSTILVAPAETVAEDEAEAEGRAEVPELITFQ